MIAVTFTPALADASAEAAALAVAAARTPGHDRTGSALLIDLHGRRQWRDTVLATDAARRLAAGVKHATAADVHVRGRIAIAAPGELSDDPWELLAASDDCGQPRIVHIGPDRFAALLDSLPLGAFSVLLRARREGDRALAGAAAIELRSRGIPHKVWGTGLGLLGERRARAGLESGGATAARSRAAAIKLLGDGGEEARRPDSLKGRLAIGPETGQALPAALGLLGAVLALALALVALGGAATAKGRAQRAADLAALSSARSMRDDFSRLFVPARLPDGRINPGHLPKASYLRRAENNARRAASKNGLDPGTIRVTFPERDSIAPLEVEVSARTPLTVAGERQDAAIDVAATARAEPDSGSVAGVGEGQPATASGGGYSGPLAYRQGKPMRPDVAASFDRLAAAAASAGHTLTINSAFRSDEEQAALFAANPDPRMVAPPGRSLHRCGTELDLGPPGAYGWLAASASRFGFVQRYSWEAWHYGFTAGPAPCSAAADRAGPEGVKSDGRAAGSAGLPGFVPAFARGPLLAAAARHDVSAALLAAQLMAESNFNPAAVSPAGAQGIAQFMPGTAAAYGLEDPFDPAAAIAAQARLMADLLGRFGSIPLALAAYNAGPGSVSGCGCIPPYPETQAYVARILGLLDGAGELPTAGASTLQVRLVK